MIIRWLRRKKKKLKIQPYVVYIGIVIVVLILSLAVSRTLPERQLVTEQAAPEFSQFVPAGATLAEGKVIEFFEAPRSSYLIAYEESSGASLTLITWDALERRFVATAMLRLATSQVRLDSVSSLTLESLGAPAPSVILVRGPLVVGAEAVFLILREGNALRLLSRYDGQAKSDAIFLVGSVGKSSFSFDLKDVDGDGVREGISKVDSPDMQKSELSTRVYQWQDGAFIFDNDLSWAMSRSNDVFPEPR